MRIFPNCSAFLGALLLVASASAQDGARLITHAFFVAGPTFTGIIDEQGKEQWSAPTAGARDGWVLNNGHILITWANRVLEFDNAKEVVWEYQLDPSNQELSTAQRLDTGNTLITELGANPRIVEVSDAGEVKSETPIRPESDNIHMQTRMSRKLDNGNYLVPHLFGYAVREYAPSGEIVQEFATDTEWFGGRDTKHWPFTAIRLPDGNTLVGCTYGNHVVEFDSAGEIAWDVDNEDVGGIIHDSCGVQRLPNGNTVIASYGAKEGVKLFEVTRDKEVVWTYEGSHRVHHFQILTTNGEPLPGKPMK